MELLSIDIETTGLDKANDEIIQIAMVSSTGKVFSKKIRPTKQMISEEATARHGLTLQCLEKCPTFDEVYPQITDILSKFKNLVMFNAEFDYSILSRQIKEQGGNFSLYDYTIIDPFKIHRKLYRNDLSSLTLFYTGEELQNAHDAKADAVAALKIYEAQIKKWPELAIPENAQALAFGENFIIGDWFEYKEDLGVYVFNKGKYRNQPIDIPLKSDIGYLAWILTLPDITIDERKFIEKSIQEAA